VKTANLKTLAPRMPTPSPESQAGLTTGRLPDDLLVEQVKRLALLSLIGVGLWTFGLVLETLLYTYREFPPPTWRGVTIDLLGIAGSVVMFIYLRQGSHAPDVKSRVSLAYLLLNAFGISMWSTWANVPTAAHMGNLSWITILILVFSMVAPTTPRTMLLVSLAAATMDPLCVLIAHLRGLAVPPPLTTFILFLPNYVCAIVATLPAHVLQGLGRRLREAQRMGSYQLVELLGHGGMGEVWRARHRLLARGAAIKLVRPELLGAHDAAEARLVLRRFEREAQATAALSSPHTIDLFDYGMTDEGTFYYVMELLIGRDAESLVREFGPLPADRVVFLLRQICHSLADAHARSLVHRDVKPANIYLCRMGLDYDFVKVLDFGLVKSSARDQLDNTATALTMEHSTTGTPAYMAPEIILGEVQVDRRADVYAIGCVAYYLLTGQLVFEADTTMKMLLQHVNAPVIPPSERSELPIPPELDALVLACLEKNPDKRPQDAEVLLRLVSNLRTASTWTNQLAKVWWEQHLPDLDAAQATDPAAHDRAHSTVV
jgi:serine/threonine-protein kinase